ncbi:RAMP superfamily CRISPR-associated protein [Prochlorothrix hollandica]|nr:RAMP superfamily CRISPR-associated protein [Prochlorothrix hollandica]
MPPNLQTSPADKPYRFVSLPDRAKKQPVTAGQECFDHQRYTGILSLTLNVETATLVASGIIALGTDVGLKEPLVKTAIQRDRQLLIPGSSLKGVVRSAFEAITASCLGLPQAKTTSKKTLHVASELAKCGAVKVSPEQTLQDKRNSRLCPACRVFGTMGWQGLACFSEAVGTGQVTTSYMPTLKSPQPAYQAYDNGQQQVTGRKFYVSTTETVPENKKNIPTQTAKPGYQFKTSLRVTNLSEQEIGALLLALGLENLDQPWKLRLGSGKPVGFGNLTVQVTEWTALAGEGSPSQTVIDRYRTYAQQPGSLTGEGLRQFQQRCMAAAKQSNYVLGPQLQQLTHILTETNYQPKEQY